MLPKMYRLPVHVRFPRGSAISTPDYVIKYSRTTLPYSRFGFIIGKAVDKRSTHRNRVRRQLRSCIEQLREHITSGSDMLFLLKKGIMGKQRDEMLEELQVVLGKDHLLITSEA